jgi:hypothetical protein
MQTLKPLAGALNAVFVRLIKNDLQIHDKKESVKPKNG